VNRGRALLVAAAAVLLMVGLLFQQDGRRMSATSYGTVAGGHRAVFELLVDLDLPVAQSFEPPELLASGTVWWIEPAGLCDEPGEPGGERDEERPDSGLRSFVEGGGTAVVFLAARASLHGNDFDDDCAGLAGLALPPRRGPDEDDDGDSAPGTEPEAEVEAETPAQDEPQQQLVQQAGVVPRVLELPWLASFPEAGDWHVRAHIADEAFVLERELGSGRLVVAADGTFLRNAWLDAGDAALLATDFVRAFGAPRIDERAHGLRLEQETMTFLTQLGALPVFLGVVALGLLFLWRGAAVPRGLPGEDLVAAPALESFVASLAALYARNGDWAHKAASYRRIATDRLRSHFGLAAEVSAARLAERLRRDGRAAEERIALLTETEPVSSERAWLVRARELDALVEEVCR
jgi:hypothetical protein